MVFCHFWGVSWLTVWLCQMNQALSHSASGTRSESHRISQTNNALVRQGTQHSTLAHVKTMAPSWCQSRQAGCSLSAILGLSVIILWAFFFFFIFLSFLPEDKNKLRSQGSMLHSESLGRKTIWDARLTSAWWRRRGSKKKKEKKDSSFELAVSKSGPKSCWNVAGCWKKNFTPAELKRLVMNSRVKINPIWH